MIERRTELSAPEFHRYRAEGRPVILSDIGVSWSAFERWTPDYLRERCGDATVQVFLDRNSDPNYETNYDAHRKDIVFRDYVDRVIGSTDSNDIYVHAQNGFMATEAGQRLLADIVPLTYLDPQRMHGNTFFWFGPGGTVTPLHHDECDIIFVQVYGRKQWTLISPRQKHLLYNNIAVFSEVDAEKPDLERHPLFRFAGTSQFVLNPREALFLPNGWWHHVRALDVSISMSFTNFYDHAR
jgi:Cupin-like domain